MIIRILSLLFFLYFPYFIFSQDLRNAEFKYVCSNQTVNAASPQPTVYNDLTAACSEIPLSSKIDFYLVRIKSGSTFTFTITPNQNIDYDFVSWLNPNLENVGLGDRGSFNNPHALGVFSIGLDLNQTRLCDDPGASSNGKVRYYDVVPGDVILIAIDRWETIDAGYQISFGGNAELDCTFTGNEYSNCTTTGESSFNLNEIKNSILSNFSTGYSVKFYLTQPDAIADLSNDIRTELFHLSTESTVLYVQVKNEFNIFEQVISITLRNVIMPDFTLLNLEFCDIQPTLNLQEAIPISIRENVQFKMRFYRTELDAINQTNEITNPANFTENLTQIYVRAENILDPACYLVQSFQISTRFTPLQTLAAYNVCLPSDHYLNLIEISTLYEELNDFNLSFFTHLDDAQNRTNAITNPSEWEINNSAKIYIRAEKEGECARFWEFPFIFHQEDFDFLQSRYVKCADNSLILDFSHEPKTLVLIGSHRVVAPNVFEITETGNYQIQYSNEEGCTFTKDFTVVLQEAPVLRRINYSNQSLTLLVDYDANNPIEYSMDMLNWQNEPQFSAVDFNRRYQFYAKYGGCVFYLGEYFPQIVPTFFSPNHDGYNDSWKVNVSSVIDQYEVKIFDRFGKILKEINYPNLIEWDGKYNGKKLPADSYWVILKVGNKASLYEINYTGWILLKNK